MLTFFYFDLYIDNFDILVSYSNKQDRPSVFASHVASQYKTDHRLVFISGSGQYGKGRPVVVYTCPVWD